MKIAAKAGMLLACLWGTGFAALQAVDVDWLCTDAEYKDGWFHHDWLGWFADVGDGWIYHYEHQMQYAQGVTTDSFYLYDLGVASWFWTSQVTYPYLYKFGNNAGWYWYYRDCAPGERWFLGDQGNLMEYSINLPYGYAYCPAGTFTMGSPPNERGRKDSPNETQHSVTLTRAFEFQRSELTASEWREVRQEADGYGYNDLGNGYLDDIKDPHGVMPIASVSWYDAIKWLNLHSEVDGLVPAYYSSPAFGEGTIFRTGTGTVHVNWAVNGYRLPTEAEWEYACRAGTTTAFYTGPITYTSVSPVDPSLDLAGWYRGNSGDVPHLPGEKQPNAWGIYDTHGNIWEWCWDWEAPYTAEPVTDPVGPAEGELRIIRSGGYHYEARFARSASRISIPPEIVSPELGFRAVRTLQP